MGECGEGGGAGDDGGGRRRIPVVYYLSRNRHLEHPHFIEVPLFSSSSSHSELSFLLRDFTARLNAVRGQGMAEMYSWSCKRSYKSGFVWHDLSPDDPVLPASADEYVLKGSELSLPLPPAPSSPPPPPPPAKRPHPRHKSTSSSASPPPPSNHHPKPLSQLSVSSSPDQQRSPASVSSGPRSPPHQPHVTYHKPLPSVDASTQTDDPVTKSRSISMDDSMLFHPQLVNPNPVTKTTSRRSETLESLIRAEGSKINQFRVLEEDEDIVFTNAGPRLSPATYLMHLISCGSISVKDYRRYGFVPIYRPTYVQVPIHSPIYASTSTRFLTRMEDKEYFSGSIVETKRQIDDIIGDGVPVLKRSSSYNADRICKSSDDWKDETEIDDSSRSRCLPRTMKLITSPLSDCPRSSSSGPDASQTPPTRTKRITNKTSSVVEPSRRKKEKLFRIEERLTSGARVVIQSRVPCDQSEDDAGT